MNDQWLLKNPSEPRQVAAPREDRPDITASEIADFSYCPRSWWLKRVGGHKAQGSQLGEGTSAHGNVGKLVACTIHLERVVKVLVWGVAIIAAGVVFLLLRAL